MNERIYPPMPNGMVYPPENGYTDREIEQAAYSAEVYAAVTDLMSTLEHDDGNGTGNARLDDVLLAVWQWLMVIQRATGRLAKHDELNAIDIEGMKALRK